MKINPIINTFNVKNNISLIQNYNSRIKLSDCRVDSVSFKGIMPDKVKEDIKLCVYDLDETLLEGPQNIRDKVLDFSKDNNRTLVYSSARPLSKVLPLIEDSVLIMPDFIVTNNGTNIYENINGNMTEINSWSEKLAGSFNKNEIHDFMLNIAKENMFSENDLKKMPLTPIPAGQRDFAGSKITEYEVYNSPLNIYFMMAPEIFEKTKPLIEKELAERNIQAKVMFQNYSKESLKLEKLEQYFPHNAAVNMRNHALPRLNDDGSIDVAIITAYSDKGEATEFIRQKLNIKPNETFAAGDAENDYPNTNKGYFFGFLANSTEGLKRLIDLQLQNIIKTTKNGVEGIYEIIE